MRPCFACDVVRKAGRNDDRAEQYLRAQEPVSVDQPPTHDEGRHPEEGGCHCDEKSSRTNDGTRSRGATT
jgi:hypothetical protein